MQERAYRSGSQELRITVEQDAIFGPLIMLGEGGSEWAHENQATGPLPPLNMALSHYLVLQVVKGEKIYGHSARCGL